MEWGSFGNFLAMGGYAWFVWGSYGVTAAIIVIEILLARSRLRRARAAVSRPRPPGN